MLHLSPIIVLNTLISINKIVENLTILDAMKVLRLVQKAVKELEN